MARPIDESVQLRRSKIEWSKTADTAREQINLILKSFGQRLQTGDLSVAGQLEILEGLQKVAGAANTAVLTTIRSEKANEESRQPAEASSEDILAQLSGGKG